MDYLSASAKEWSPSYSVLGCLPDMADSVLRWAYDKQVSCDPQETPKYLDALLDLSKGRDSIELQEYVMMERSRGILSATDIRNAYAEFGTQDTGLSDENLITLFEIQVTS